MFRRLLVLGACAATTVGLASPAHATSPHRPNRPDQQLSATARVMRVRPNGPNSTTTVHAAAANLVYRGGHLGHGVETAPRVYLVFYGKQWGASHVTNGDLLFANDPAGVAPVLQHFLRGLGGAERWSTSTTQYCDGVAVGTTQCGTAGHHVTHAAGSPLAGVWYDTTYNAPANPGTSSFRAAAGRAAKHFANQTPAANASAQYMIVTPTGIVPVGFGTQYCAYHDAYTNTIIGDVAFVALPYIPNAGAGCGAGFVHSGRAGALDGVTIVAGHEYGEAVTDPVPPSGWTDASGAENGDKCAWIRSGAGATIDVAFSTGTFPVQSLWSNNANHGLGGCVVYYSSATNQH